jgi:hypothetical protein
LNKTSRWKIQINYRLKWRKYFLNYNWLRNIYINRSMFVPIYKTRDSNEPRSLISAENSSIRGRGWGSFFSHANVNGDRDGDAVSHGDPLNLHVTMSSCTKINSYLVKRSIIVQICSFWSTHNDFLHLTICVSENILY